MIFLTSSMEQVRHSYVRLNEGTDGGIYNSSQLPNGVAYGTYNFCNMPHVRQQEYVNPSNGSMTLKYVEVSDRRSLAEYRWFSDTKSEPQITHFPTKYVNYSERLILGYRLVLQYYEGLLLSATGQWHSEL